jgi:transglutaminase-like putative cysteine protease
MTRFIVCLLLLTTIAPSSSFVIRTPASLTKIAPARSPVFLAVSDDEDEDLKRVKVPIRRQRGRFAGDEEEEYDPDEFYDVDDEYDDEFDDDEEDDEDDDDDDDYGLFSDVIIDNPLLDSMDPDGTAERFPELARDPRFWLDMVLLFAFLDFLSAVGPRDSLPDLQWY